MRAARRPATLTALHVLQQRTASTKMTTDLLNTSVQNDDQLLGWVHRARIFKDSKTFVDMSIKGSHEDIRKSFDHLNNKQETTREIAQQFIDQFFQHTGEFEEWSPSDYSPKPAFLEQIKDDNLRKFAQDLVAIWPSLARKVKPEVFQNQHQFSLIPVPNGFIIPGGRFKEIYYWDTLWIVEGLLLCDMHQTVKGMLENFFQMVDLYGFVPNGSRVYYLSRSQPPVLTLMVEEYVQKTQDWDWVQQNLPSIAKELKYWLQKFRNVGKYQLCQYRSDIPTPRPESFGEDIGTAGMYDNHEDKKKLFGEIRSAAESGWDFSSRWIFDSENHELHKIQPSRVIPVDLNAILCKCFKLMSGYCQRFNLLDDAQYWKEQSEQLEQAIEDILYCPEDGTWYDYDLGNQSQRKRFYASNLTPLWTESFTSDKAPEYGLKALKYLENNNLLSYPGGIPCSLVSSGQQWDFPNVWPPLQSIITVGLHKSGHPEAQKAAKQLADSYVQSNLQSFKDSGVMFEKYDATRVGKYGGGGEYITQTGFGWSNGVVLSFINLFDM